MHKVCLHDLITRKTFLAELSTIPAVEETIQIDNAQRFYLVHGVTKNISDQLEASHDFDLYVERINKEYWVNSLLDKMQNC
ncbi:hypothetical protein JZO70_08450 [Enterococcus sp. 669A]|uniref:Uncharacterized protein n=1 Tax=Candidatus Enterococcus moelleringii TaxID=2815325 RepID=A0ABS3L978_9ENTE|nr:hypothetical protein [Enterococcus sp. 669A]MBO1306188.1 hypothetical protein [Enterococcus sp. 669A]